MVMELGMAWAWLELGMGFSRLGRGISWLGTRLGAWMDSFTSELHLCRGIRT